MQRLSGDIGGLVRGEKDDCRGDFLGRPGPVGRNLSQDEALANAPEQGAGSFKVPSVIEREE